MYLLLCSSPGMFLSKFIVQMALMSVLPNISTMAMNRETTFFMPFFGIEKDSTAHQTLQLRSFFRQFPENKIPDAYYDYLRQVDIPENERRNKLFSQYPEQAEQVKREARLAELGKEDPHKIHKWIRDALEGCGEWVLIGGPPCQAYSVVGRSRNRGNSDYQAEKDHRQYLYLEYLQIIAEHQPAIFVMENVKGLLSATLKNQYIFERMYEGSSGTREKP